MSAIPQPWCSQNWSTLGACTLAQQVGITESDFSIPPFRLSSGRIDIPQSMSGTFMQLFITQSYPGQCSCHSRLGLQHFLIQQELSRGSLQPPFGSHLFCHHFVCSYSRQTYSNHTCCWPRQNVTCLSKVRFHLFFHRLSWMKPWRGTCRWQPHFVSEFAPHSYNFVKLPLVDYRSTILLLRWPV